MNPRFRQLPPVRTISLGQPLVWLVLAWRDMARVGWLSFAHGMVLAAGGAAIVLIAHDRFWLLAGALSGFLLVAPVLATSLYALSRAVERREPPTLRVVLDTWVHWQHDHPNKWAADYWSMVRFGIGLALAGTGWVLTSAALITLFAPAPILQPMDFVRHVVLDLKGWLFEAWLMLGAVMAAPIFASSVVAMPLMLDRRVTLMQALLTSWKAVLANPAPLAFWAFLIGLFSALGLASLFLGLIFVMPMLGHASWHAYRDLVDVEHWPARESEWPSSLPQDR